ncbi:hypothetical protein ACOSP7_013399 [Xanthoceras sorbifolium]
MHTPQVLLGRSTYNQLIKLRAVPQDDRAAHDEMDMEQGQDLGQQKAITLEHGQPQAQPIHDDRILTAILMEAMINSRLDVMEAGMIDLGDRMNTMGRKIDRIEIAIIQHYSRWRSRTPPQPPSR